MVQAIKIVADGALGSRGAALLEPYSDEPTNTGLLTTPPEEIYAQDARGLTRPASRPAFTRSAIAPIATCSTSTRSCTAEVPGRANLRLRVEHAQILDAADIPRFARLNVIASMQTTHATSDMPWVATRLGAERTAEGAYVWQKLMKSGAVLANGSDFPVEEPNPMLGFYAGITRQDPDGQPTGRLDARRTTVARGSAQVVHLECRLRRARRNRARLDRARQIGDLVLLDRDVMTVDPKNILGAQVLLTVIGGEVVYEPKQAAR